MALGPLSAITQDKIDRLTDRLAKTNQAPLMALKAAMRYAKLRGDKYGRDAGADGARRERPKPAPPLAAASEA